MILEGGEMGDIIGGYFIRKAVSPQVKLRLLNSPVTGRVTGRENSVMGRVMGRNNENENGNSVTGRGAGQKRRSPLPEWYPRAPLRDITAVCKAMEKINLLKDNEVEPQRLSLTPITTNQIKPFKSDPTVLDFLTPIKVLYTPEIKEYERKLTESIEKLEKIVKRNLKREKKKMNTPCVSKREIRVRTLMSMR